MVKRRFRAPGYSVSTKGHSVLHRGTYGFTPRRFPGYEYAPDYVPRKIYDTSAEEYSLGNRVDHATIYSDASLYDTYDTASKSRGRDAQLLQSATAAIVSSEPHTASPRASAAVKRVTRTPAPPPVRKPLPYRKEVARYPTSQVPAYFLPTRVIVVGAQSPRRGVYVVPVGARVYDPPYVEGKYEPRSKSPFVDDYSLLPYLYRRRAVLAAYEKNISRPKRAQAPPRYRPRYLRYGYGTYRKPRRAKAAIVASTVEVAPRRKRPRSKFAADKLRATRPIGEESSGYEVPTTSLHASRPTMDWDDTSEMPLPSDRRAIRDVDGFTKPRNLLSWQYRLESRMDPTDIIYKPGSFVRMREQVRHAHDKLDRHRQLLDRYLGDGAPSYNVHSNVQRKMEEMERRDPSSKKY